MKHHRYQARNLHRLNQQPLSLQRLNQAALNLQQPIRQAPLQRKLLQLVIGQFLSQLASTLLVGLMPITSLASGMNRTNHLGVQSMVI